MIGPKNSCCRIYMKDGEALALVPRPQACRLPKFIALPNPNIGTALISYHLQAMDHHHQNSPTQPVFRYPRHIPSDTLEHAVATVDLVELHGRGHSPCKCVRNAVFAGS